MARVKVDSKPLMEYITGEERRKTITASLEKVYNVKQLCRVLSDVYNTELLGYEKRDTIICGSTFVQSIIPFLKSYMGKLKSRNIGDGIYRYVLGKGGKGERICALSEGSLPLTAYVTDRERLARIEVKLEEVTNLKQLSRVMSDVYNTELLGYENRDSIIHSSIFVQSIMPYLKSYKGALESKAISAGICRYLLGKGGKGKREKRQEYCRMILFLLQHISPTRNGLQG